MRLRSPWISLGIIAIFCLAGVASAQSDSTKKDETTKTPAAKTASNQAKNDKAKDSKPKTELATFGGGCFWCFEAVFERVKGVKNVVSGYAGGDVPNPTYEMVCSGLTGHAEVVQIEFDPSVVSFEELLNLFWKAHDPTTENAQGPDFGTNYRSIVLYHNDEQKAATLKSFKALTAAHAYPNPIVTQLVPFTKFYPAEPHHQNYYRNHRGDPYSQMIIAPKLQSMKAATTKPAKSTKTK